MIVVITVRGAEWPLQSFRRGEYGFPAPDLRTMTYERLFHARRVPLATYVFADLDRLAAWELRLAGDLYQRMRAADLVCLNDPARAMSRVELLRALHRAGINPFDVYRADEMPAPKRFPVFLRPEDFHRVRRPALLESQAELDAALLALRQGGQALRGTLVVEYCPAPFDHRLWHKWGTFRIGERMSVDHIGVHVHWFVKYGSWKQLNDPVVAEEHAAVTGNRFAEDVRKAFEIGGIEFGRADHATVDGRTVIYEINTNPRVGNYVPDKIPLRFATQKLARERLAAALEAIDCKETGARRLTRGKLFRSERRWSFGARVPVRP